MLPRRTLLLPVLIGLLAAISLSACVVYPARGRYAAGVVAVAPPPPQVEVVGAPPTPGYLWIGGYWNWVGGRHVWVNGYWAAPRPGFYWVPNAWVHVHGGWRMRAGYWARR